jgi:hypothetical protein
LDSLPISTPIPFQLNIVSVSKEMKRSEYDAQVAKGKEVFPAPPSTPSAVVLRIDKRVFLKARSFRTDVLLDGPNLMPHNCQVIAEEPIWIPASSNKKGDELGEVKRTIQFEGALAFACAPTFAIETIVCQVRPPIPATAPSSLHFG